MSLTAALIESLQNKVAQLSQELDEALKRAQAAEQELERLKALRH